MAWLVVWLVALSFWHFGGHWSSFAHFTRYLGCDGFIRAFGGSAAWSVVSSALRVAGGWFRLFFPPFWFGVVVVSAALFWAAASLLWSAAGAGYCSPALMRCLLGGSSWIK